MGNAKTISMFFIGTGHTIDENYNILSALFEFVPTESYIEVGRVAETPKLDFPPRDNFKKGEKHHKILYSGAPDYPDFGMANQAGEYLRNVVEHAIGIIEQIEVTLTGADDSLSVNLVGHSRGAANALLLAGTLFEHGLHAAVTCNLFLIDTVKVTGGGFNISKSPPFLKWETNPSRLTRILQSNVNECYHIVMEDDVKFKGVIGIFELYSISTAENSNASITNSRFPGTHGTATQLNKRLKAGEPIPASDLATTVIFEPYSHLWPIAGAALSRALQKLQAWGTPLNTYGKQLATPEIEFKYFNMISRHNAIVSRFANARTINNVALSKVGEKQEIFLVPGTNKTTYRSKKLLDKFGENLLRHHRIFVNQRHVELAIQFLGRDFVEIIFKLHNGEVKLDPNSDSVVTMQPSPSNVDRNLQKGAVDASKEQAILQTIQRTIFRFPNLYTVLTREQFHWNNKPLNQSIRQVRIST